MIIKDKKLLSNKCKKVTKEEGKFIGAKLLKILRSHEGAIGLAANQIGIDAAVCVINVNKPIILVNPIIVGKFGKLTFAESCLSFPEDIVFTNRYRSVVVRDELNGETVFDGDILECVCVQHEIDHLNGVTMHERSI